MSDESKMLEVVKVRKKCIVFVSGSHKRNTGFEVDIKWFDA